VVITGLQVIVVVDVIIIVVVTVLQVGFGVVVVS